MNYVIGARCAAAAYDGVVKRWRRWLIENLTSIALAGARRVELESVSGRPECLASRSLLHS
jgi:hypothetical protein